MSRWVWSCPCGRTSFAETKVLAQRQLIAHQQSKGHGVVERLEEYGERIAQAAVLEYNKKERDRA